MRGRLQGKRALIFGGGTGIGYACAVAMIAEGASVFLSQRRRHVLEQAIDRLSRVGGEAGFEAGDATSEEDVIRVTARAAEYLRGLDILLISTGTSGITPILGTTLQAF